ncbi:uncharacterized protein LOC113474958 [Ciona intestinalis]
MTHRILMYRSSRDIGKCWPIQTCQSSNKTVEKWRCIKDMSLSHSREVCHSIINKTESLISCAFNNRLYMGSYLCSPFANQCVFGDYIAPKKSYKYGFKCTARSSYACGGGAIYIPQSNLEDSDVNCADKSDLCFVHGKLKCFKCLDGQLLISPKQICDGIFDCFDLSDECLCGDQQVCSSVMANKGNCTDGEVFTNNSGCVNPRVIFEKNSNFSLSIEAGHHFVKMRIYEVEKKYKCHKFNIYGKKCDGNLECPYGDDECGCESELGSCKHVKKCFFGNYKYRVCDGVVSAIVHYPSQIEKLHRAQRGGDTRFDDFIDLCTEGFDEANCTNRHLCIEGASISISSSRVCDGVVDCDDGSDELESLCRGSRFYCLNKDPISVPKTTVEDGIKDCSDGSDECPVNTTRSTIFSSQFEMIANPILSAIFWCMGVVSIFGNSLVIVTTIKRQVKAKAPSSTAQINAWFITNLAVSDLLMGVYLLSISIQGAIFSGRYCYHDLEWRSGTLCSLMGATAVLATEASVFMMTIMTTHRLVSVMRPFALRNTYFCLCLINWRAWDKLWRASPKVCKKIARAPAILCSLAIGWAVACVLAFTPLIKLPSGYFVLSVWYRNRFYKTDEVSKDLIFKLVNRVGSNSENNWLSAVERLRTTFELYEVKGEIGYYGETSVCMPRLFVNRGEATWEYSTSIITTNFILFIYILISYIVIYRKGTAMGSEKRAAANKKLQGRIMRLVFTDFCCWMPICVMTFASLSGIRIDKVVYAVTAGFLLPINSAVNPLIYTNVVVKAFCKLAAKISSLKR